MATLRSGAGLRVILPSPLHIGTPPRRRYFIFIGPLAWRYRDRPMGGTFESIYRSEESVSIQENGVTYRSYSGRARWARGNRSITCTTIYIPPGSPVVWTRPRCCRSVRHRPPKVGFPCGCLQLGRRVKSVVRGRMIG